MNTGTLTQWATIEKLFHEKEIWKARMNTHLELARDHRREADKCQREINAIDEELKLIREGFNPHSEAFRSRVEEIRQSIL